MHVSIIAINRVKHLSGDLFIVWQSNWCFIHNLVIKYTGIYGCGNLLLLFRLRYFIRITDSRKS